MAIHRASSDYHALTNASEHIAEENTWRSRSPRRSLAHRSATDDFACGHKLENRAEPILRSATPTSGSIEEQRQTVRCADVMNFRRY